ncbi:hypothetical protein SBOR_7932 [Sclerotinia borealis F-4128]|uniref:Uncharacterized protein n=1 Tax=Sclerotinia borealis (strain F-4128) TaxID=1432307 RepID=W9CAT2_SCLBF|nr:hypothetical protein SBOR_7932 [Sclerotinia borealis F-4128]
MSNSSQTLNASSKPSTSFSTTSSSRPFSAPPAPAQQEPQRSTSQDETSPFLKDLTLVAEAAKRAQMACLMRDLDDCEM